MNTILTDIISQDPNASQIDTAIRIYYFESKNHCFGIGYKLAVT